jgi:hypothetical protein
MDDFESAVVADTMKLVSATKTIVPMFDNPIEKVAEFKKLLTEDGRMIVVGTPLGPKSMCYKSCKAFFKIDSADMFTYVTGKSEDADKRIAKIPGTKNEFYGDFIE